MNEEIFEIRIRVKGPREVLEKIVDFVLELQPVVLQMFGINILGAITLKEEEENG